MAFKTQPKFSFGQKVISKDSSEIFEVSAVIFHENKRFMYLVKPDSVIHQCDYDGGYWESGLEVYEEPKPKKKVTLYRYTMSNRISGNIYQTTWNSVETAVDTKFIEVIKTESKEVEYDDV